MVTPKKLQIMVGMVVLACSFIAWDVQAQDYELSPERKQELEQELEEGDGVLLGMATHFANLLLVSKGANRDSRETLKIDDALLNASLDAIEEDVAASRVAGCMGLVIIQDALADDGFYEDLIKARLVRREQMACSSVSMVHQAFAHVIEQMRAE
ncbi:MAG: hypothetical protein AAF442_00120 [Pseudomonadota bacterium]